VGSLLLRVTAASQTKRYRWFAASTSNGGKLNDAISLVRCFYE
jgi:hypothetical protein